MTLSQRAVLLTFQAGLTPYDHETVTRRAVDAAILECEKAGWLAPSRTPAWYEVTAAGREALR